MTIHHNHNLLYLLALCVTHKHCCVLLRASSSFPRPFAFICSPCLAILFFLLPPDCSVAPRLAGRYPKVPPRVELESPSQLDDDEVGSVLRFDQDLIRVRACGLMIEKRLKIKRVVLQISGTTTGVL